MLPILLFLLAFAGIQRPPIPDDIVREYVVTQIDDETTADCSTTPGSGARFSGEPLEIDWNFSNEPEFSHTLPPTQPLSVELLPNFPGNYGTNGTNSMRIVPTRPPELPKTPTITPEPPPLAILTITGLTLLFLLFGHNRRRR